MIIEGLTKAFGDKIIFDGLSLAFDNGVPTLICGPSGVGKTTLFRIIAGLESADSGKVIMDGGDRVSLMFQEPRLFPWQTVLENAVSSLGKEKRQAAAELLTELGLGDELDSYPRSLSGGMQRRVAAARALLFPADVFLFDEPFAGLDPESAAVLADVILRNTWDKTAVIISHETGMLPSDIRIVTL